VTLTFRGFDCAPAVVTDLIGVSPHKVGERGQTHKSGSSIKRSFVSYALALPEGTRLDEMIPAMLEHLGGVEVLLRAKHRVSPEFLEFDLLLPIKNSSNQEGGFLSEASISDLHALGATLSFGFVSASRDDVA